MKKVARQALTSGWEVIQGNQVLKFAEYNVNLEEVLNMQPLPRVDTDPHSLGLFIPGSEFKEPSIGASLGPDQGPRMLPPQTGKTSPFMTLCPESATPMQHPRNKLAAILQSQVTNREPTGSWEMSPIGECTMGGILVETPSCFNLQAPLVLIHPSPII
ncbi:hypothetical protein BS47DRAFT_1369325 [Hydnum rufescens UP504]|uniref:Uncharacterized protein n=1 Tax=Hydnum rufescens UP504 TaxID=1448309 RepID=A0A9P6AEI7_9AGAM|nr:hypothetical protein BS47DRAFT_1369325 [Hydnum rufescens UP504]